MTQAEEASHSNANENIRGESNPTLCEGALPAAYVNEHDMPGDVFIRVRHSRIHSVFFFFFQQKVSKYCVKLAPPERQERSRKRTSARKLKSDENHLRTEHVHVTSRALKTPHLMLEPRRRPPLPLRLPPFSRVRSVNTTTVIHACTAGCPLQDPRFHFTIPVLPFIRSPTNPRIPTGHRPQTTDHRPQTNASPPAAHWPGPPEIPDQRYQTREPADQYLLHRPQNHRAIQLASKPQTTEEHDLLHLGALQKCPHFDDTKARREGGMTDR